MTPHKSQGRGTFILDREFAEIGRLRRASGTTDPKVFEEMDAMLTGFKSQGRWDLLEGLRDKRFTPLYVFGWFKRRHVDRIPSADVLAGLGATWEAWSTALDCSDEHRRSLGITRKALSISEDHILSDHPPYLWDFLAPRRHAVPRLPA